MTGVEIDFVVTDSLKALELYEIIFEAERVEVTAYPRGLNEAVFTIYGVRFHMLDENPQYMLNAPKPNELKSVWFNITVPDVQDTYSKAMAAGCTEIQAVTEFADIGVSNAIFADTFEYTWMLHQIHKVVDFEERARILEEQLKKEEK